jgi:hypothetical protein
LRKPGGGFLDRAATERVHRRLMHAEPHAPACQLGQPVLCGSRDGIPVSALRLCSSARLAVAAAEEGSAAVIARAMAALDRTAEVVAMESN